MARPTWDELRPKVALLRAVEEQVQAAAREEERILREALRPGPPGWLYDPEARRWSYVEGDLTVLLWWAPPSYGMPGEWRFRTETSTGQMTGGGAWRGSREVVMAEVLRFVREGETDAT
jgi:hypothetical protein